MPSMCRGSSLVCTYLYNMDVSVGRCIGISQVHLPELVHETLSYSTHCEVAFLRLVSHEVGPGCEMLSH